VRSPNSGKARDFSAAFFFVFGFSSAQSTPLPSGPRHARWIGRTN
jgi:hypothetical protein